MTTSYSYDSTNQLTNDGVNSFAYDGTGNRVGNTTTIGNQLSNDGTWTYTYDNECNLIQKTKGLSAETWAYSYDHCNQLIAAFQFEKDPLNGGVELQEDEYLYDVFGNQIEKDDLLPGSSSAQHYAFDQWNPTGIGVTGVTAVVQPVLPARHLVRQRPLPRVAVDGQYAFCEVQVAQAPKERWQRQGPANWLGLVGLVGGGPALVPGGCGLVSLPVVGQQLGQVVAWLGRQAAQDLT